MNFHLLRTANCKPQTPFATQKQRIFILGAGGRLGMALVREWRKKFPDHEIVGLGRQEIDFEHPKSALEVMKVFGLKKEEVIVNSGALTDVDRCEREPALATTVNAITPTLLASLAADVGARFIHLSTDYVFDGTLERPYREIDTPAPLSQYGVSKLAGEQGVLATSDHHVVARVSWVFGPDRPSFVDQIIRRALSSTEAAAIHDKISSPTYTYDLSCWLSLFLNKKTAGGIYHLCNSGHCSWRDYGEYALQCAARHGMPLLTTSVAPLQLAEMKNFLAKRPVQTALDTTKFSVLLGEPLRSWQEAVEEYVGTIV
ncbi:MAG: dTDP-4-dehydrorhamnose reductase [Chthoniobacterales bacterium]